MSKIYFVATGRDEENYFRKLIQDKELIFFRKLSEIPADAEIICINFQQRIDQRFLEAHPKLRLIASRSTSKDHLDLEACRQRGVVVRTAEAFGENAVAEHVFALLLALTHNLRACYQAVQKSNVDYEELRGIELFGKTLGVVGCGRVGLHVIRLAAGFRMQVLGYDSNPHPFIAELLQFDYVSFEQLLEQSDIITLHVPINTNTRHIINRQAINRCKRGVLIINTARGALLDLDAVLDGLESGHIGGLGIDVLEDESLFHSGATSILSKQIAERVRIAAAERKAR
ncbi:MAG: hypothetical protein NZL93_01000, partial [Chthoniobacterales bacterium]|nr:hypothetical protein [Chthoniobacterales bacterium]